MVPLIEGEWSYYGGGQFKGGRIVIVSEVSSLERENVHVMVVVSLMEGEWSCYRGDLFNGGRKVMLLERSGQFQWRQNGHVTEVARGRIVLLQIWSV